MSEITCSMGTKLCSNGDYVLDPFQNSTMFHIRTVTNTTYQMALTQDVLQLVTRICLETCCYVWTKFGCIFVCLTLSGQLLTS